MEYDEFKRRVAKAGLNLREFAELVRLSGNTISNYAQKGHVPCHLAVAATLMAEMAEAQLDFREPLKELVLPPKKSRDPMRATGFGRSKQFKIEFRSSDVKQQ